MDEVLADFGVWDGVTAEEVVEFLEGQGLRRVLVENEALLIALVERLKWLDGDLEIVATFGTGLANAVANGSI